MSADRFSEMYPLLITETCSHAHFYDEFLRTTTHSLLFFANFWITHPCLRKIYRKRDPCLENLGPKNPPIWAAHTRTLNMLCTPPPGCQQESNFVIANNTGSLSTTESRTVDEMRKRRNNMTESHKSVTFLWVGSS